MNTPPAELNDLLRTVYRTLGFSFSDPIAEPESNEYAAHTFILNGKNIRFRIANITPTKNGQFVTLWKRNDLGITAPFERTDNIDFVIIFTRKEERMGHFVFPASELVNRGIFSTPQSAGKRGFRVYPPWDETTSKQAEESQQWQVEYFLDLSADLDLERAKRLYPM